VSGEGRDGITRDVFLEQDLLVLARAVARSDRRELRFQTRALVDTDAEVVDELGPGDRQVETLGYDVDVVGGAAAGQDVAVSVPDDTAGRGERDSADDVLACDGALRR
jgi:hypothetical protein